MAIPRVITADTQSGIQTTDSTSWSLTYPTNLAAGDLILAIMAVDGVPNVPTMPALWVRDRDGDGTSQVACAFGKKLAIGNETGSFTVTQTAAEQGCWITLRITDWEGTLGSTFGNGAAGAAIPRAAAGGSGTTPDPPIFNPALWDNEEVLWLVAGASDGGDTTYTDFPTNYTNISAQESGGAAGAALGIAMRGDSNSSENPAAFTTDVSEEWVAVTFAIRGRLPTPPIFLPNMRVGRVGGGS